MIETPHYPWTGVITNEKAREALLPQLFGPLSKEETRLLGTYTEEVSHLLPIVCASAAARTARNKKHDPSSTMRLVQMISLDDPSIDRDELFDLLNTLFRTRYGAPTTNDDLRRLQLDGDEYIPS